MQITEVAHIPKAEPNKGSRPIFARFFSRPLQNKIVRRSKNKRRSAGVTSELEEDVFKQERLASKIRFIDDLHLPQED